MWYQVRAAISDWPSPHPFSRPLLSKSPTKKYKISTPERSRPRQGSAPVRGVCVHACQVPRYWPLHPTSRPQSPYLKTKSTSCGRFEGPNGHHGDTWTRQVSRYWPLHPISRPQSPHLKTKSCGFGRFPSGTRIVDSAISSDFGLWVSEFGTSGVCAPESLP